MTVKLLFLGFVFFIGHSLVCGQTTKPFAELDRRVKTQRGGFSGSKQPLATAFTAERKRLGKQFEVELLKYLGDDVEKHYWISIFLEADSYLQGNASLPHLSLLIKQQGLSLLERRTDEDGLFMVVSLSVTAAVLSEQLNFRALARTHKTRAEDLMTKDDLYRAGFPAMNKLERNLYKAIEYEKPKK